mgnify:CR=1 FL=1
MTNTYPTRVIKASRVFARDLRAWEARCLATGATQTTYTVVGLSQTTLGREARAGNHALTCNALSGSNVGWACTQLLIDTRRYTNGVKRRPHPLRPSAQRQTTTRTLSAS